MLKKALLASAGLLALIAPEVFEDYFAALRGSRYLWLYQLFCIAWALTIAGAMVPWSKLRGPARALPERRPKVALVRYGPPGNRDQWDGLIFQNDGETAYDLTVPDVRLGTAELIIGGTWNVLNPGDTMFCEFFIRQNDGSLEGSLADVMRQQGIHRFRLSIWYRDFDQRWYRTECLLERKFSGHNGIVIGPFEQHLESGPPPRATDPLTLQGLSIAQHARMFPPKGH